MAGGERNVRIRFTGDTKGLDKAAEGGRRQISKWRSGWQKFNAVALPAAAGVGLATLAVARDSVALSRRIEELDTKSRTVFEGQLGSVQRWAEQNRKAFGTSSREVVALATNMADLLKPMGFTAAEAAKMSTKMLDLAGALAKWSGGQKTAAEVSDILTKAMLGERDELKSLGISISEADVQARLAAKGQEKLTGAAQQQAVAIATQELILEKSTDAQKAWANGGRKAAQEQNSLASTVQTLREKLATILGPAIARATELLSQFAGWAERNKGVVMALGGTLVGLAAAVFIVNGAMKVWAAVSAVATAAQWALNVAMKANPIGIVITIIMALIGVIILAWKRSETFRKIVTAVWNGIKSAISAVVNWLTSTAWPFIKRVWDAIVRGVTNVKNRVVAAFNAVRSGIGTAVDWVASKWAWLRDKISGAVSGIKGFLSGMWNGLTSGLKAAVNWAIDKINGLIGAINNVTGAVGIPAIPRIPRLEKGGVARAGRTYLVGEAGPELFTPGRTGRVTSNRDMAALGGGGGAQVLEAHIHIGSEVVRVVRAELREAGRGVRRAVIAGTGGAL